MIKTRLAISIIFLFSSVTVSLAKNLKELEEIIDIIISQEQQYKPDQKTEPREIDKEKKEEEKTSRADFQPVTSSPGRALLQTAIQLYDASLFQRARSNFQKLKSEHTEQFGDIAAIWLSRIDMKFRKYESAIKELESISPESGEYPTSLFIHGEVLVKMGRIENAIVYFNNMATQFPEHELADNALLVLGRLYLDLNKGGQALEASVKIIKQYKGRETEDDGLYLLGQTFERASAVRDFGIARKIYRNFLKKSADQNEPNYFNSPLKERVKRDLNNLEISYFRLEN